MYNFYLYLKGMQYIDPENEETRHYSLSLLFEEYLKLSRNEKWIKIRQMFDQATFRLKDLEASYRTINNWDKQNLFLRERIGNKWRTFNFYELIWIEIITDLRAFGLSLEKIQIIKKAIFAQPQENLYWPLEVACALTLLPKPTPTYLVIFPDSHAEIVAVHQLAFVEVFGKSYIKIELNSIINKILDRDDTPFFTNVYKNNDFKLAEFISNNDTYPELNIKFDSNGDIKSMATNKNLNTGSIETLNSELAKMQYGTATVKIENGKTAYISIEEKIKFDD